MSKYIYMFLPIIAVVLISGCTQLAQYDFVTYSTSSFSIQYPPSWNYTSTQSLDVIFTAPTQDPATLSVASHETDLTPREAANNAWISQSVLFDYTIVSGGDVSLSGKPAFERTYRWVDRAHNLNMTQIQTWVDDGDTLYVLTGTSLTDDFRMYEPTLTRMIDSFEIKTPGPQGPPGPAGPPGPPGPTGNVTNITANHTNTTFPPNMTANNTNLTGINNSKINVTIPVNQTFTYMAKLQGCQEFPQRNTTGAGNGTFIIDTQNNTVTYNITFSNLSSDENAAHIHGFANIGQNAPPVHTLALGTSKVGIWAYNESDESAILGGRAYVNIHSINFPDGEIRGQINSTAFTCAE